MFSVFVIAMVIIALQVVITVVLVSAFAGGVIDRSTHDILRCSSGFALGLAIGWFMPTVLAEIALLVAQIGADYAIRQYAVVRVADGCLQRSAV